MFTPSRCYKGWKGMASRRPGNCRASAIYKKGAELVVDARDRRRSSAASSGDEYREPPIAAALAGATGLKRPEI